MEFTLTIDSIKYFDEKHVSIELIMKHTDMPDGTRYKQPVEAITIVRAPLAVLETWGIGRKVIVTIEPLP